MRNEQIIEKSSHVVEDRFRVEEQFREEGEVLRI